VIELDSQFTKSVSDYCPSFIAGLGDNVALGVMYDTYFKIVMISGRYKIVKNVAADLYYRLDGSNTWMADLRGKYFFNQTYFLLLGAGFEMKNIAIGLDCAFPANDFSNLMIEVVVDYLIKNIRLI